MSLSLVAQWAHPPVGRRMVGDQETAPGPDQGPWSLPPAPQPHITPPLGKAKGISEAGTSAPQPRTPRPPPPPNPLPPQGTPSSVPSPANPREEIGRTEHLTSRCCSHDERQSQKSYPQPLRPHAGGRGRAAAGRRPPVLLRSAPGQAGAGGSAASAQAARRNPPLQPVHCC